MKNIGLVLPYDYKLFSVATILDVFETVNGLYAKNKREPPFAITIIQSPEQIERYGHSFHGHPVRSLQSRMKMDLVLMPAFTTANRYKTLGKNKMYIPWLQKQFRSGAEIASVCTGAYL